MVRGLLACSDYGSNECSQVALGLVEQLKFTFVIVWGCSFVLDFIIYAFARIALILDTSLPQQSPPKIERNVHVGYDNVSLRTKRFIDPDLKFKTSALSQTG